MKKSIIFSAVVAAMLVGCNDTKKEEKHAVAQTTHEVVASTTETAKETTTKAVEKTAEATKEVAQKAVETAKKTAETTVEKAKEAVKEAEKKVEEKKEEVKKAVAEATAPKADGKTLFTTCAGCHGAKGEKKALGKSQAIGGWDAKKVEDALNGYKAGTYGGAMKGVMAGQAAKLDEAKIKALAEYISTLK